MASSLVPVLVNVIEPVPAPNDNGSGQVLARINQCLVVRINVLVLSELIVISFEDRLIVKI